ncbi:MAG: hypothetical protein ACOZAA_06425 [Pseudomonadota bacterium]
MPNVAGPEIDRPEALNSRRRAPLRRASAQANIARLVAFALVAFWLGAAAAQSTPVCLGKTDATGGRMRFVALEAHAGAFESAGFRRFQCPTLSRTIIDGQKARCDRIRASIDVGKNMLADLYGLSVTQMCDATDAWFSTQK